MLYYQILVLKFLDNLQIFGPQKKNTKFHCRELEITIHDCLQVY